MLGRMLTIFFMLSLLSLSTGSTVSGVSCGRCVAPTFQGRRFYLPFCTEDKTSGEKKSHVSVCDAICVDNANFSKGSCDGCESKCSPVFSPVCSSPSQSESVLYANECHAQCAGLTSEDLDDCPGIKNVVPGKTKLPPNFLLTPHELQNANSDRHTENANNDNVEDEDI